MQQRTHTRSEAPFATLGDLSGAPRLGGLDGGSESHGKAYGGVIYWLVVEPTHLKNMFVKLEIFPNFRGKNKKCLKPPPSYIMLYIYINSWNPLVLYFGG